MLHAQQWRNPPPPPAHALLITVTGGCSTHNILNEVVCHIHSQNAEYFQDESLVLQCTGTAYWCFCTCYVLSLRSGQFGGQKGLCPLEKPCEMPHYMFCPRKKNIPDLQIQRTQRVKTINLKMMKLISMLSSIFNVK
jgi:hypothetical protein